jgi:hypothetical protein
VNGIEVETARDHLRVHTMMGHKHLALATRCLGSLVRAHDGQASVIVHEDGSVTEEDRIEFERVVPNSSFVLKSRADGPVNEFLARYPACRKLRDNLVFGLKIFDIQILELGEHLAYSDCDILFLKRVSGLFTPPPDPEAGGIFMYDPLQAYCLRSTQLLVTSGLRLADRLNGGLLYFRRSAFDWDLVEWFLSHERFTVHPYWKEQTAWSVLAASTKSWMWSERAVRVVKSERDFNNDLTVAHFVSNYRSLFAKAPLFDAHAAPANIQCTPGKLCTPVGLLRDELRRRGLGSTDRRDR